MLMVSIRVVLLKFEIRTVTNFKPLDDAVVDRPCAGDNVPTVENTACQVTGRTHQFPLECHWFTNQCILTALA